MLTAAYILKSQDIVFTSQKEVVESLIYLNELRHSKELVKQETGIEVPRVCEEELTLNETLCKLAKLRVLEMIRNDRTSHKSIYDTRGYDECVGYNTSTTIKNHIIQYIIDKGVSSLGHRKMLILDYGNKVIGIASAISPEGKHFSCILTQSGRLKNVVLTKKGYNKCNPFIKNVKIMTIYSS